jgi:hypothetical protein
MVVDAAPAGSIIKIGPGRYSSITISKKLTIIGMGYLLTGNDNQLTNNSVVSGNIQFLPGSEYSTLMAMEVTDQVLIFDSHIST